MALDGLLGKLGIGKGVSLGSLGEKLSGNLMPKGQSGLGKGALSPIAIDFGVGSLKVLQVLGGTPHALAAAASLETPSGLLHDHKRRLELQVQALPKLIKQAGFKGKRAVCAIPAWDGICKHMPVAGAINKHSIDAALSQHFPELGMTHAYRVVEPPSDLRMKGDVLVLAAKRDLVNRLMEAMVQSRLEPVGMQSELLCSLKSFDHLRKREGDLVQTTLFLDLGTFCTKAMITRGGDLACARVIEMGGYHLDDLIAKQAALTFDDARKARFATDSQVSMAKVVEAHTSTAADPGTDRRRVDTAPGFSGDILQQPAVAVGPEGTDLSESLEILTDEIRLLVRYFTAQTDGQQRLDRIVFMGGESRHRGLTQHLARQLRLPAQVGDPMARLARSGKEPSLNVDFSRAQPGWAVALGLCLAPTDL